MKMVTAAPEVEYMIEVIVGSLSDTGTHYRPSSFPLISLNILRMFNAARDYLAPLQRDAAAVPL